VTAPLQWGAFAPQGWKLEYTGWSAADAWDRTKELAQLTEQLGYQHLWVYDHVETVPRREPTHVFEAWTVMAALAEITSTARLGQLVTCSSYRNAGLLAKQAACVDVMSGGRLILGIGAGWYHEEYAAFGWPFLSAGERLRAMDETITVVRQLWTDERVTFAGDHVQMTDALCDPKPLQSLPPVWIGGGGEKVTLRLVAEHGDAWNTFGPPESYAHKNAVLDEWCAKVGRDPSEVERTVAIDGSEVGNAEAYLDAGATHIIVMTGHPYDLDPVAGLLELAKA
jgi:F420-dependent oxidoreductase-like protein